MNQFPLVSILINNYNYGQFLQEAIDSALNQTYPQLEVIVVDDGSTDNSQEIIKGYGDQIIAILKENEGQASAFNSGFEVSQGEIIFLLDSDDLFLPDKVEKVVSALKSNSELGWCFHPLKLKQDNQYLPSEGNHPEKSGEYDLRQDIQTKGKLGHSLPFNVPATSALCFTRSLLEKILPMPIAEEISLSDDYIKYLALGYSQGVALFEELAIQRIHNHNRYTFKKNKQLTTAKIAILTAYYMRQKSKIFNKFCNNNFAYGVSILSQKKTNLSGYDKNIKQYYENINILEKIKINLRIIYYSIKF